MSTKTEILNMALSHIAVSKRVANFDTEDSEEARMGRLFYDVARDNTLGDIVWPFTTKIVALALIEEEPNTEWGYAYQYPSDCITLRRVLSGIRRDTRQTRVSTKIAQGAGGKVIWTDSEDAQIEYTVRNPDPSMYSSYIVMALSLYLAHLIAPSLTKGDKNKLGERALRLFEWEMTKAEAHALNEQQDEEAPESEFVRAREGNLSLGED